MDCLEYERYKIVGTSGGGPYAFALTHISVKLQAQGTLLFAPAAPIEAPRSCESMSSYLWGLLTFFPLLMELTLKLEYFIGDKKWRKGIWAKDLPTEELRETDWGRYRAPCENRYSCSFMFMVAAHSIAIRDLSWRM
jgi:hypothetical protein